MWRTLQFIPASSEKMLSKAGSSQADALIFDLEDSVAIDEKERARNLLRQFIENFENPNNCGIIVRINPFDTFGREDLKLLSRMEKINAFMLPKATCEDVKLLSDILDNAEKQYIFAAKKFRIIALIETAASMLDAYNIALSSDRMMGMLFGAEDFSTQMGMIRTTAGDEIYVARNLHAMACRAAGVEAYDTPFTDTKNKDTLAADTINGKKMGMTGKAAIHPAQVETINGIYTPTQEEVDKARRIIAANEEAKREGKGAFSVDGKMVDAPVVRRAENLLALYDSIKERTAK